MRPAVAHQPARSDELSECWSAQQRSVLSSQPTALLCRQAQPAAVLWADRALIALVLATALSSSCQQQMSETLTTVGHSLLRSPTLAPNLFPVGQHFCSCSCSGTQDAPLDELLLRAQTLQLALDFRLFAEVRSGRSLLYWYTLAWHGYAGRASSVLM